MEIQHFNSFKLLLPEDNLDKFISIDNDLLYVTDGYKRFMAEHTNELIKKYEEFAQETTNKNHGKTAQYWMGYVNMLHLYHEFLRSIRIGDLDLYIYCSQQMTALFFMFNHQNYSCWLTVYHNKLLKLKNSHPNIYEEFQNGCFSLKRASEPLSRIQIDLTLEQTINADAACQHSGIILLTNSISVQQCWAQSHSIYTSILSKLFEELGMTSEVDISEELKLHLVSDTKLLSLGEDNFIHHQYHESFGSAIEKEHLFNIANRKAALGETANFSQRLDHWFQCMRLHHQRLD